MNRPEQALHRSIVSGLRAVLPRDWIIAHIPNGGYRTKVEAAIFKAMGVVPGMPDIMILGEAHWGAATWFMEVKAPGGSITPNQRAMHETLRNFGFAVAVVHSVDEALSAARSWRLPIRIAA